MHTWRTYLLEALAVSFLYLLANAGERAVVLRQGLREQKEPSYKTGVRTVKNSNMHIQLLYLRAESNADHFLINVQISGTF